MKKQNALHRSFAILVCASRRGSALLITLAFVVLLTVLVVSFLSRALLEQHISSSSANQVKSELYAEGIGAILIGDLEQEIINGSTATTSGSTTIYTPNTAANMVPMYDYPSCPTGATGPSAILANVLKVSTSAPATTPMASTFPTATTALTTTASFNGRSVSLKRWIESALVDPSATLPTPNWIMVARDGSNPTTFSNSGANDVTYKSSATTNAKTVIGRYAYVIYDEGGLLDMNVAGYPTTAAPTPASILAKASYRSGQATADLTQLTASGSPLFSNAQIDTLIGWRNTASVSPPAPAGTVTTPANLSLGNATNYFNFVQNNTSGSLSTANSSVYNNGSTYYTDQAFTSRYQMIQFIQGLLGTTNAPKALQYLTHFSRSISQPSYIPPVNDPTVSGSLAVNSTLTGTTPTSTGTDTTFNAGKTNTALGADSGINPMFLAVRVTGTFTRNDGSSANVGEPLVKKRFNLNRLAWITYEGPLCDGHYSGVATSASQITNNADLQILANQYHNTYGLSWAFLQKGTAGNIYNYFGLSWLKDDPAIRTKPLGDNQYKWFYNHSVSNVASTSTSSAYTSLSTLLASPATIARLTALTDREPDYAELLKAGLIAGSKAKTANLPTGNKTPAYANPSSTQITISATMPDNIAFQSDTSISTAVIQIVANVIDQFDLDGFPTRIIYEDPNILLPREYDGIENLPYFYRVRCGCLENVPYVATSSTATGTATTIVTPGSITAPGAYSFLLMPEIWNPHDQNSPRCAVDPTTGKYLVDSSNNVLCPTSFRLVADSIDPDDVLTTTGSYSLANVKNTYWYLGGNTTGTGNPSQANHDYYYSSTQDGYPAVTSLQGTDTYTSPSPWAAGATGQNQMASSCTTFPVFPDNSALIFSIPTVNGSPTSTTTPVSDVGNSFFREPTLLLTPNIPSGSNLAAAGSYNVLTQKNATAIPGLTTNLNQVDLQAAGYAGSGYLKGSDNKQYLGIFLGVNPAAWFSYPIPTAGNLSASPPINPYNPSSSAPPPRWANVATTWDTRDFNQNGSNSHNFKTANSNFVTYRVQYSNSNSNIVGSGSEWTTYDTKFTLSGCRTGITSVGSPANYLLSGNEYSVAYDPRTGRFAVPHACDVTPPGYYSKSTGNYTSSYGWVTTGTDSVSLYTARPDASNGWWVSQFEGPANDPADAMPLAYGWVTSCGGTIISTNVAPLGLTAQNDPHFTPNGKVGSSGSPPTSTYGNGGTTPQYYADPDGVVRRGTAAYYPGTGTVGLPLAPANTFSTAGIATPSPSGQTLSRPIVLNRPFKSTAELGYVFSGTPWKNLDFSTPESGDVALLDLFTVGETTNINGLIAGKVNLNTQQIPVLQAILAGSYKDEEYNYQFNGSSSPTYALTNLSGSISGEANVIATKLAARTLSTNTAAGQGPLRNVSELVGRFVSNSTVSDPNSSNVYIDGAKTYAGFAGDLINNSNDLTSAFTLLGTASSTSAIQRMRESSIRALSACGQTRVWNLMIDVVAQTGNYPPAATNFDQFSVQGEQRFWIHLAIDRFTGQIIDKQVEVVKE